MAGCGQRTWTGVDGLRDLRNGQEVWGGGGWLGPVHQMGSRLEKQFSRRNLTRLSLQCSLERYSTQQPMEELLGRLTPPLPEWSAETRRPERPEGDRVGRTCTQVGPRHCSTGCAPKLVRPSGGGAGDRVGPRRCGNVPPRPAPRPADSQSARSTPGPRGLMHTRPASGSVPLRVPEGSRHCCWRICWAKFLAG